MDLIRLLLPAAVINENSKKTIEFGPDSETIEKIRFQMNW